MKRAAFVAMLLVACGGEIVADPADAGVDAPSVDAGRCDGTEYIYDCQSKWPGYRRGYSAKCSGVSTAYPCAVLDQHLPDSFVCCP